MLLSKLSLARLPKHLVKSGLSNQLSCQLSNQLSNQQLSKSYTTTQTNEKTIKRHTLKDQIVQKIKIGGPITIRDYMKIVLTAPNSVRAKGLFLCSIEHFSSKNKIR